VPVIKSRSGQKNAIAGGSMEAAAELGVLFGCLKGVCGKCATTVLFGLSYLSAPTEEEVAMDLDPARRLMCQCRINKGTVKLDLD
jgi:ferredoxin